VTKGVLLTEHEEGQCRAIIGEDSYTGIAVYCGEPVVEGVSKKPSSWCDCHYKLYMVRHGERSRATEPLVFSFIKSEADRRRAHIRKLLEKSNSVEEKPAKPEPEIDTSKYIKLSEAASKYFGMSYNAAYRAVRHGKIPTMKIGRSRYCEIEIVEKMAEEATNG
jgi:helix-turn-helix protein